MTDHHDKQPSCILMGLGPLCAQAIEYLLDHRLMEIRGVISADDRVVTLARDRGLDTLHIRNKFSYAMCKDQIDPFLAAIEYDYLWSVINAMRLPMWVVDKARRRAINFHDSELPKYAGIDATSWAIMRREPHHAVTWHLMVTEIDEGDIVKQILVPIANDETADSLNARCLEVGFAAFKELLDEIGRDAVVQRAQSPIDRTYYSRSKPHLPEMSIWTHGIVSWQWTGEDIEALVRGLDYRTSRNSLGTAKLLVDDDFYVLTSLRLGPISSLPPGTVAAIASDELVVATSTRDVLVTGLCTIDGRRSSIDELARRHSLARGRRLDEVSPALVQRVKQLDKDMMWKEASWAAAIQDCKLSPAITTSGASVPCSGPVDVPLAEMTRRDLQRLVSDNAWSLGTLLLGAFSSYAAEQHEVDRVSVWYSDEEYRRGVAGLTQLFSAFAPCRPGRHGSVFACYDDAAAQIAHLKQQKYFLYDLAYRYPALRDGLGLDPWRQFALVVRGASGAPVPGHAFGLALEVTGEVGDFGLRFTSASLDAEALGGHARRFAARLATLVGDVVELAS